IEQLLAGANGLHFVRGRWVEVDPERLRQMLDEFRAVATAAEKDGLSFGEAMRLLSGAHVTGGVDAAAGPTGHRSSPDRGWPGRWPAFAIQPNSRDWIPATR